jgi:hypothetical protein
MRGESLSTDFRYDGYTFTLADGQAMDLNCYEYLSCEITTGSALEIARRNSASFAPFYHRQVIGDSAEGAIGLVRIRNTSGGAVVGTILTSTRRIAWTQIQISGVVSTSLTGVTIGGTNADGVAAIANGALATDSYPNLWNGASWDRWKGDATGGAYVQGKVNDGSAHGTHKPLLVGGTDGTNAQTLNVDASGNLKIVVGTGNLACNTAQINGVSPSMGSGTNGTGVQRVTLATDQAQCTVAGLFSVKVDQTTDGTTNKVRAVLQANATITPENLGLAAAGVPRLGLATPTGHTVIESVVGTNAGFAKASAGQVYGYTFTNRTAAVKVLRIYNKASAPTVGTDVAIIEHIIPATGSVSVSFPEGRAFTTGIAYAITGAAAYNDATATAAHDAVAAISWQ